MSAVIDGLMDRPLWQRLALWAFGLALIFYLFWQFLLADTLAQVDELENKVQTLNTSISQERRVARDLPKFRKEVEELQGKLNLALQELPDAREIPDLLSRISDLAKDSGLIVNLFKTMPENMKEFYAEVPVTINVEGSYHQVGSFFDDIAQLPRIVNVSQLAMHEPKVDEGLVRVKADCVATTFRYLTEEERAKASAANAASQKRGARKKK